MSSQGSSDSADTASSGPDAAVDPSASAPTEPQDSEAPRQAGSTSAKKRSFRLWIAGFLVAGLAVALSISALTSQLRVCDDIVARVGSQPAVRSCRPLEITDAPVILILLLALGFVLPDVRKISIAGVVELEREVHEQERRIEQLGSRIDMLVSSVASSRASIYFEQTLPSGTSVTLNEGVFAQKEQLLAEEIGELRDRD